MRTDGWSFTNHPFPCKLYGTLCGAPLWNYYFSFLQLLGYRCLQINYVFIYLYWWHNSSPPPHVTSPTSKKPWTSSGLTHLTPGISINYVFKSSLVLFLVLFGSFFSSFFSQDWKIITSCVKVRLSATQGNSLFSMFYHDLQWQDFNFGYVPYGNIFSLREAGTLYHLVKSVFRFIIHALIIK